MGDISIRPLFALDELRAMVELQQVFWGEDAEAVVPAQMLYSLACHGGHVLAVFDGEQPVGMLIGFIGTGGPANAKLTPDTLELVSKRMVVLPGYRGHGIGYRLKLAQRELALRQGLRLVTWTFDPVMALNAHLNIHKLGGISTRYLPDYYGTAEGGGLVVLGSSDRLCVEWWVASERVVGWLGGQAHEPVGDGMPSGMPVLNPASWDAAGWPGPGMLAARLPESARVLLEIPPDFNALLAHDSELARDWRAHIRAAFGLAFAGGLAVTDFRRTTHEGRSRAFYMLESGGALADSSSPGWEE